MRLDIYAEALHVLEWLWKTVGTYRRNPSPPKILMDNAQSAEEYPIFNCGFSYFALPMLVDTFL